MYSRQNKNSPSLQHVNLFDHTVILIHVNRTSAFLGGGEEPQQVDEDIVVVPRDPPPANSIEVGPCIEVLVDGPQANDRGVVHPAGLEYPLDGPECVRLFSAARYHSRIAIEPVLVGGNDIIG